MIYIRIINAHNICLRMYGDVFKFKKFLYAVPASHYQDMAALSWLDNQP